MLKVFTIYSLVLLVISCVLLGLKLIMSDDAKTRISSVLSLLLNASVVYVVIKLFQML